MSRLHDTGENRTSEWYFGLSTVRCGERYRRGFCGQLADPHASTEGLLKCLWVGESLQDFCVNARMHGRRRDEEIQPRDWLTLWDTAKMDIEYFPPLPVSPNGYSGGL